MRLMRNMGLANIIREGNTPMLNSMIQSGKGEGMISMDDSLMAALDAKKILPQDAFAKATNKSRFEDLVPDDPS